MNDLSKQAWFKDTRTQSLMTALAAQGRPARFVGGCVRDALLGRPIHDIDIATPELPENVIRLLDQAGIKSVPTGLDHGTITAVLEGRTFEITTLRSDVSTDGRRATVAFTQDWQEDAARRDFTINAMSVGLDGVVHDYFDGLGDLTAGIVRFVGDPYRRIREDYLRLLRFFRFSAFYAQTTVDQTALLACSDLAQGLQQLSGERISQEFLGLLSAPHPHKWIALMKRLGVLDQIFSHFDNLDALEALCFLEGQQSDPLRRLALLLPPDTRVVTEIATKWRLSNMQHKRLRGARLLKAGDVIDDYNLNALLYRFGPDAVRDQFLIQCALRDQVSLSDKETGILRHISKWEEDPLVFPLHGRDLIACGFQAGPRLGQVLKQVEDWWCDKGCLPDKAACLEQVTYVDQSDE